MTHRVFARVSETPPLSCTARARVEESFRYRRRRWFNFNRARENIVFDDRGVLFGRWRYGALPIAIYPGDDLPDRAS